MSSASAIFLALILVLQTIVLFVVCRVEESAAGGPVFGRAFRWPGFPSQFTYPQRLAGEDKGSYSGSFRLPKSSCSLVDSLSAIANGRRRITRSAAAESCCKMTCNPSRYYVDGGKVHSGKDHNRSLMRDIISPPRAVPWPLSLHPPLLSSTRLRCPCCKTVYPRFAAANKLVCSD